MKLVFIGPPGSGKGTLATRLSLELGWNHISTGDIIKDHIKRETDLGVMAKQIVMSGKLIPDEIVSNLVDSTLSTLASDCKGYILDGYPRTLAQTEWLISKYQVDIYVVFKVSEDTVIERISGRRVHSPSGRIYHLKFMPPKSEGKDDVTGEPLTQRKDDAPENIQERLRVYHKETSPIINYLTQEHLPILYIDAEQDASSLFNDLKSKLSELSSSH